MQKKQDQRELTLFQVRNIQILTHLFQFDAINDDIVELLRLSELDYFALLDKYKLLEQKVNIDEKTNLLKYKSDYLTNILKTASRVFYGMKKVFYNIAFVRIDIDDFSHFNNYYGHDVGDKVLITLANILHENSRPTDYVIRFGGEELDIILPATDVKGARVYADKIFGKIHEMNVSHDGQQLKVTVSAGISYFTYNFHDTRFIQDHEIVALYERLQREADNALYEAKYQGKDRFCFFSPDKKEEYAKIRKLYVK